jgi:hypothetical protein
VSKGNLFEKNQTIKPYKKHDSPIRDNAELQSKLFDRLHKQSVHIQEAKKWRELEKAQDELEKCTFIPNQHKYAGIKNLNGSKTVRAISNAGFTMFDTQSKTSRIK